MSVKTVIFCTFRPLRKQYQSIARSVFLQTVGGGSGTSRKKTHGDTTEKANGLYSNARLFEKGLQLFEGLTWRPLFLSEPHKYDVVLNLSGDTQLQLSKHLLKTVCTDLVNLIFNVVAADHMMSVNDESQITQDVIIFPRSFHRNTIELYVQCDCCRCALKSWQSCQEET